MIWHVLPSLLLAGTSACTYDQDAQLETLRLATQKIPLAVLDEAARRITWKDAAGSYTLVYGGCDHLVHELVAEVQRSTLDAEGGLVAYALELARAHWDAAESSLLAHGLATDSLHSDTRNGSVRRLEILESDYDEVSVTETSRDDGVEIRMLWVRTF